MRMMLKFRFPKDPGNQLVRSGKVGQIFQQIMEDLKPEAAYFFPEGGERAGLIVFEMRESFQVADVAERFWLGIGGHVEMTPVMAVDDLQKALAGIDQVVQKYS